MPSGSGKQIDLTPRLPLARPGRIKARDGPPTVSDRFRTGPEGPALSTLPAKGGRILQAEASEATSTFRPGPMEELRATFFT